MRFTVNETPQGIVAPPKDACKVQGCTHNRRPNHKLRSYAFCKGHGGLRHQMPKKKYKELLTNNELVIVE